MHFERQNFGITIMKDKDNSERAIATLKIAKMIRSNKKLSTKGEKDKDIDQVIEPWK